jgi:hypothetical protein
LEEATAPCLRSLSNNALSRGGTIPKLDALFVELRLLPQPTGPLRLLEQEPAAPFDSKPTRRTVAMNLPGITERQETQNRVVAS